MSTRRAPAHAGVRAARCSRHGGIGRRRGSPVVVVEAASERRRPARCGPRTARRRQVRPDGEPGNRWVHGRRSERGPRQDVGKSLPRFAACQDERQQMLIAASIWQIPDNPGRDLPGDITSRMPDTEAWREPRRPQVEIDCGWKQLRRTAGRANHGAAARCGRFAPAARASSPRRLEPTGDDAAPPGRPRCDRGARFPAAADGLTPVRCAPRCSTPRIRHGSTSRRPPTSECRVFPSPCARSRARAGPRRAAGRVPRPTKTAG